MPSRARRRYLTSMLLETWNNGDGDRFYFDPVSKEIREKENIVEVQATQQQSSCGSSDTVVLTPVHPTDVALRKPHNRRTRQASRLAPVPTVKTKRQGTEDQIERRLQELLDQRLQAERKQMQAERDLIRQEMQQERERAKQERERAQQQMQHVQAQVRGLEAALQTRDAQMEMLLERLGMKDKRT